MNRPTSSSHLSTTFSQLPNHHTFIASSLFTVQRPRITRSLSVVTLARLPTSSYPKITDRSVMLHLVSGTNFLYLFVNLMLVPVVPPFPTHQSFIPLPVTSSSLDSPLCSSITPSLFQSRLKIYLFHKSYAPRSFTLSPWLISRIFARTIFVWATRSLFLVFPYFFVSVPYARLRWPSRRLLRARKLTIGLLLTSG